MTAQQNLLGMLLFQVFVLSSRRILMFLTGYKMVEPAK